MPPGVRLVRAEPGASSSGFTQRLRILERARKHCGERGFDALARPVQPPTRMGYQFVTCPASGQLELIESDETALGTLIVDCSGFHTACLRDCPRSCAAILDLRDHQVAPREVEDTEETSAVIWAPRGLAG